MTKIELKAFCELMMASDPWPLTEADKNIITTFLDLESKKHGFENWVDAYHHL